MYPRAVLAFTLPSGESRIVPLSVGEPVTIGRSRASTIKLNLPSVSRKHAQVYFDREVFWIEDMGSSNGTFVNQKQVQKARISLGDVLKCGDFMLTLKAERNKTSTPPNGVSRPPHTQDGSLPPDQAVDTRFPSLGSRRDFTERNRVSDGVDPRHPWHSRAPTHGPDQSSGQRSSNSVSPSSREPAELGTGEVSAEDIRSVSLSRAYSDDKLQENRRGNLSMTPGQASLSTHPSRYSGEVPASQFANTDDTQTELMRLKIAEQQLMDEVNHLNKAHENLLTQLQEEREKVSALEGELDQQHQRVQDMSRTLQDLEAETGAIESRNLRQLDTLLVERDSLAAELNNLEQQLERSSQEASRRVEDLETQLDQSHQDYQLLLSKVEDSQSEGTQMELVNLRRENNELLSQLESQQSSISQRRDETSVSSVSLPQPNRDATDPDWARHTARQDQLIKELLALRKAHRALKNTLRTAESEPYTSNRSIQATEQDVSMTTSEDEDPSILDEESQSFAGSEEGNADRFTGSVNNRRAWKGLL